MNESGLVLDTRTDRVYYVTVRDPDDPKQFGFLLGPYPTHQEAIDRVGRGRELACGANDRAVWYAYGTASLPAAFRPLPKTVFDQ